MINKVLMMTGNFKKEDIKNYRSLFVGLEVIFMK